MAQFIRFPTHSEGALSHVVTLNVDAISSIMMAAGGMTTIRTVDGHSVQVSGEMHAKITEELKVTDIS